MIYYLVYISAASYMYSEAEMAQILTISRRNNANKDITGILLYHEGSILQVLEGDRQMVTDLFLKIKDDNRHQRIFKMVDGMCEERSFADWSMGFKRVANGEWNEYEGYIKTNKAALLSLIKEKNIKIDATVKSFVKQNFS